MEAQHVETEVILTNPTGLHARPASLLVQTAAKFKSNITLEKKDAVLVLRASWEYSL